MKPADYHREVQRLRALQGGGEGNAEPIRATRLTLSQIVELLLTRQAGSEHSSVTLSRNARGETQIEVVVRTGADSEVSTVDEAAAKCRELYESLRGAFPLASGFVGATPEGASKPS